jgi:hypothetical protein
MKILDMSAGNRAGWFDKHYRDALYVDVRPEVSPDIVADTRKLPVEIGDGYDFDCIRSTACKLRQER